MQAGSSDPTASGRCAYHPERTALGLCDRCGSFYCGECFKERAGRRICSACLALPGVDHIAETRRRFWGKRDNFVWYFGLVGGLGALSGLVVAVAAAQWSGIAANALMLGLFASYFMLQRWSRKALFVLAPLTLVGAVGEQPAQLAGAGLGALIWTLFFFAALTSPRNKLAFKIDVDDAEVQRLYDQYVSNPNAMRALVYGVLSLFLPVLAPVALAFGIQSMRRVKPNAWPPIGGRRAAVTGVVVSVVALVFWCSALAAWLAT
jgi:hypothetical protein